MSLPQPSANQAYCNVSALEGGQLSIAEEAIKRPFTSGVMLSMPSLCFLLQHSTRKEKFVFDLGIRRDVENYPDVVAKQIQSGITPCEVPQDVVESLARGGLGPDDIDYVAISHLHFDHIGDPSLFKKSTFLLGEDSRILNSAQAGFPVNSQAAFASDVPPSSQTRFLSPEGWSAVGPFPRALDFYGDGSLYIIDSPGHLPGHINVLARTSSDGSWVYLAGDSCHHCSILSGEANIAVGAPWNPRYCVHEDLARTEKHLKHIQKLKTFPKVHVLLAHDTPWYLENKDGPAFFPGKLDPRKD
ncbi:hypothetical protein CC1G_07143 [Coprinopsis cinerea okayama7|uniref:Metallo-beta-lactamase domain-containing protein n=1 Tax=Coprinopsis cinerea (strain Okayama-7 / 130 / ATCC MYA-4618 / FGSC 9003) TaxID=240176 RepID=A8NR80_COPC7|nr:hypothetical protein CC1G_07143 [Coprinopsis cinerea okayama7\|eukprot:XP_001835719.1 hypothetical protein CC1G_07143 [Coprinopsis cinerea okayama7\